MALRDVLAQQHDDGLAQLDRVLFTQRSGRNERNLEAEKAGMIAAYHAELAAASNDDEKQKLSSQHELNMNTLREAIARQRAARAQQQKAELQKRRILKEEGDLQDQQAASLSQAVSDSDRDNLTARFASEMAELESRLSTADEALSTHKNSVQTILREQNAQFDSDPHLTQAALVLTGRTSRSTARATGRTTGRSTGRNTGRPASPSAVRAKGGLKSSLKKAPSASSAVASAPLPSVDDAPPTPADTGVKSPEVISAPTSIKQDVAAEVGAAEQVLPTAPCPPFHILDTPSAFNDSDDSAVKEWFQQQVISMTHAYSGDVALQQGLQPMSMEQIVSDNETLKTHIQSHESVVAENNAAAVGADDVRKAIKDSDAACEKAVSKAAKLQKKHASLLEAVGALQADAESGSMAVEVKTLESSIAHLKEELERQSQRQEDLEVKWSRYQALTPRDTLKSKTKVLQAESVGEGKEADTIEEDLATLQEEIKKLKASRSDIDILIQTEGNLTPRDQLKQRLSLDLSKLATVDETKRSLDKTISDLEKDMASQCEVVDGALQDIAAAESQRDDALAVAALAHNSAESNLEQKKAEIVAAVELEAEQSELQMKSESAKALSDSIQKVKDQIAAGDVPVDEAMQAQALSVESLLLSEKAGSSRDDLRELVRIAKSNLESQTLGATEVAAALDEIGQTVQLVTASKGQANAALEEFNQGTPRKNLQKKLADAVKLKSSVGHQIQLSNQQLLQATQQFASELSQRQQAEQRLEEFSLLTPRNKLREDLASAKASSAEAIQRKEGLKATVESGSVEKERSDDMQLENEALMGRLANETKTAEQHLQKTGDIVGQANELLSDIQGAIDRFRPIKGTLQEDLEADADPAEDDWDSGHQEFQDWISQTYNEIDVPFTPCDS